LSGLALEISDALVRTIWENSLDREIRAMDPLLDPDSGLAGGPNSLVIQRDELAKQGGGTLRVQFRYQLRNRGRAADEVQKGHEAAPDFATMDVVVNTLRNAAAISSPIQDQWILPDAMDESRDMLADWAASRLSFALHAHATGLAGITDNAYRLHNAIAAVNAEYIIRPDGKAADSLNENDVFDVNLLRDAMQRVQLLRPKIRPAQTPWGPKFAVFISPEQAFSLKQSDSAWYGAMIAALQGGDKGSGVFTRALGSFDDFLIFVSDFVPPGLNTAETAIASGTRRAWVGGAGALTTVFGRGWKVAPGYSANRWSWVRESEDYDHQHAVCVRSILGVKRPRFTRPGESSARENGVLVIETAAPVPSGMSAATLYQDWTDAGLTIA
jgi:hypothetical protein